MRLTKRSLWLLLGAIGVAAAVHWVTVAVGQQPAAAPKPSDGPLVRWLDLSGKPAEAVTKENKAFHRDMRRLQRQVQIETLKLATLIEANETTEDQLRAQFDALSKAHLAVHGRIADFLIAVRPHLDADQRARFNDLLGRHFRGYGGPEPGPGMHQRDGHRPKHGVRPGDRPPDRPGMRGPGGGRLGHGFGPEGPRGRRPGAEGLGPGHPDSDRPERGFRPGGRDRPRGERGFGPGGPDDRGMPRGERRFRPDDRGDRDRPPRPIDADLPEPQVPVDDDRPRR